MSLRHGILGMLSKWDATGYDIKKEFDQYVSVFWHSHLSQIYPELSKMEKEGLVESRFIIQDGKPDKKVYTITATGKQELVDWLRQYPISPKNKDTFLMQVFFMDQLSLDEIVEQITFYKSKRAARLKELQQKLQVSWEDLQQRNHISTRIVMGIAVLKRGIDQEKQAILWCEETIQMIQSCRVLWEQSDQKMPLEALKTVVLNYFGEA